MKQHKVKIWILSAALLIMSLQGCIKDKSYDFNGNMEKDLEIISSYLSANSISATYDEQTGVSYIIHETEGNAYKTAKNSDMIFDYEVSVLEEGTTVGSPLYSSEDSETSPVVHALGNSGEYINGITIGFDVGMFLIHTGDSATFYVPSPLAFQDQSFTDVPANSILVYKVKYHGIRKLEEDYTKIETYLDENNLTASYDDEYGVPFVIHEQSYPVLIDKSKTIKIYYKGTLLDGTEFDSNFGKAPLSFKFGDLIPGLEIGMKHLSVGDSATVFVPSSFAYKDVERTKIPKDSPLKFTIKVISQE